MEKLKKQLEELEEKIRSGEFAPLSANGRQKSPNLVRSAIRKYCTENDLTMTQFRQSINVNPASFNKFMNGKYQNPWSATSNSTYMAAGAFLARKALEAKIEKLEAKKTESKKEEADKSSKTKEGAKETKSKANGKEDRDALVATINAVSLESEAVFDDCDVVRAKINGFIKKHGFTMSGFGKCIGVNAGSISRFLSQKGEGAGAANGCCK